MDIGVSLRSGYAPMDARLGAQWMVERARAAAEAGLDSLFVGDHHNVPVPYYQNVAILGRLLAEWDDRPAGALFLLPLWHPVLLAEQIGTLASIASGPFILQCAVGGGEEQFRCFDTSLRERAKRFEASLKIVRALCRGESVTTTDGPWKIEQARIAPIPPDPLEVWIGGSSAPAVDRAGRMGDAFLIGPEATPAEVKVLVQSYRDACARADSDRGTPGRARCGHRRASSRGGRSDRRTRLSRFRSGGRRVREPEPGHRSLRRAGGVGLYRRHRAPSRRGPGRGSGVVRTAGDGSGKPPLSF